MAKGLCMLPSDIETDDAYRHLSRRHFLQVMGMTSAGVMLAGGNDGMNTVVPTNNGRYYSQRKGVAIPAEKALDIGQGFGLNPNLTYLKALYDRGHVALVDGVGYPGQSLSHFESMSTWMGAQASAGFTSGWLGRW
jgi:uncharacterized protein (DUF1501 family)